MPSASRVQTWAYAVLLLLDTLLATLLGTTVAEAAADSGSSDHPNALSLLVAGFVFSLVTFAYLLMFIIANQLSPDSALVWIASDCAALAMLAIFGFGCAFAFTARGVLDLGQCGASASAQCSLAVGAGALLWVCSVFILVMLVLVVIVKAVSHPGRQNWARSLHSLSHISFKPRPKSHAEELSANRGSGIFVDDPFSEPEAVRPILSVDLVDGDDSSPPLVARRPTSSSRRYQAAPDSSSGSRHSRSYHSLNSIADLSPERSRPQQPERRHVPPSMPSHYSNRSDHSLASSRSAPFERANPAHAPPVPPLPKTVVDEKARVRAVVQDTVNEEVRKQELLLSQSARRGMPLRIETAPRAGVNPNDDAIVSAASDVFSVMADFAGSPRSPRTMINEYPPMALPVPSSLSQVVEMSRESSPRPPMLVSGLGPESRHPPKQERAPSYTPPIDDSALWSMSASHPPLVSVGSSHQPHSSLGSWNGFHETPLYESAASASSGLPFPSVGVQDRHPWPAPPLAYPPANQGTNASDEATLFFPARPIPPQPPQAPSRAEQEEATLFFNAKPKLPPPPPAVVADEDEATLFFKGPRIPGPPRARPSQPPAQEAEATLFFNRPPGPEASTQDAEEETLFFNAPAITRPPAAAGPPARTRPLPSPGSLSSGSRSPDVQPAAEEEEATLFFPSSRRNG